ncbi:MAG: DUF5686 and carboxypeptidase regulatory-like domain-containing protein, partial [Cyclobacteriaceae bacterium]|nr:DUF5686 and carboxypeptidase regulatory-like domain-containing protein [Cyclobacteriaceae bacterium]
MRLILLSFFVSFFASLTSFAQEFIVQGKVTDASSGDPIPFVNVIFKGTGTGATTDFDGNFLIKSLRPTDSVMATYIGYKPKTKAIRKGVRQQVVNFQLEEDVTNLQEVVVKAGENPAFTILRGVVDNKSKNDKRSLSAYEYESYTKMEVDVDHISEKFRERKVMKKIAQVLDSIDRVAGEDGKPILPLFITESVSKIYFRDNPSFKIEEILHTKITGVGVEDGSTVNQLVGSSFQEYNFYQNWLPILGKNFVSPIADGWRLYYDYDLLDSLMVGDDFCYRIDFYPKNPLELAFTGSMWIAKKNFALKQIDAAVGKEANVNFIEKIKIQQELAPLEEGPWMPVKNRILINISELSKNSAGMLAKFYTSNKNFKVNTPKAVAFYDQAIKVKEDATVFTEDTYWDSLRHEPLSKTEKSVYKMIDTLRNIPIVKTYTEIFKALVDGYYDLGKIEVGPYLRTIAYNNIEGTRVSVGFKTNRKFDKHMLYSGFLAYGFYDQRFKYQASAQRILSRRRWTTLTGRVTYDMVRLGIDDDALNANPLFLTAARWGNFRRGYYYNEGYVSLQRELFRGFSQKISMRYWTFDPSYRFGALLDP